MNQLILRGLNPLLLCLGHDVLFQNLRSLQKLRGKCLQPLSGILIRDRVSQSQSTLRLTSQIFCFTH
jgi:hypothetical protein